MSNEATDILANSYGVAMSSLWVPVAVVGVVLFGGVFVGTQLGKRRRTKRKVQDKDYGHSNIILPAVFSLLSLLIGFTFGFVLGWEDDRKTAVMEEALAIGTAYNMIDLVAGPGRAELKKAMAEYVQTRRPADFDTITPEELLARFDVASKAPQALWATARAVLDDDVPAPIRAAVGGALNDALDAGTRRATSMSQSVTPFAQGVLILIAGVTILLVGYSEANRGKVVNFVLLTVICLFWLVFALFFDVERPTTGLVRVDLSAISDTVAQIEADAALQTD